MKKRFITSGTTDLTLYNGVKPIFQPYMEPKEKLEEAVKNGGLRPDTFITLKHGEVKLL